MTTGAQQDTPEQGPLERLLGQVLNRQTAEPAPVETPPAQPDPPAQPEAPEWATNLTQAVTGLTEQLAKAPGTVSQPKVSGQPVGTDAPRQTDPVDAIMSLTNEQYADPDVEKLVREIMNKRLSEEFKSGLYGGGQGIGRMVSG